MQPKSSSDPGFEDPNLEGERTYQLLTGTYLWSPVFGLEVASGRAELKSNSKTQAQAGESHYSPVTSYDVSISSGFIMMHLDVSAFRFLLSYFRPTNGTRC